MPTTADARALLAELGVSGHDRAHERPAEHSPTVRWIETDEQLEACALRTVILDHEGRVLELWARDTWWMTGQEDAYGERIDLPARVLYTPEDES